VPEVFWAAFGGAAAAGLITLIAVITAEWFRWFLDRPLIKVKMSWGVLVMQDGSVDENRQVILTAANTHNKPVTIESFGLTFKRKQWGSMLLAPQANCQLPYQLDGGKSLTQWSEIKQILSALKSEERVPRDLKSAYFAASSGKTYEGKIKKYIIRTLEKETSKGVWQSAQ
jgi:hypothetical protein